MNRRGLAVDFLGLTVAMCGMVWMRWLNSEALDITGAFLLWIGVAGFTPAIRMAWSASIKWIRGNGATLSRVGRVTRIGLPSLLAGVATGALALSDGTVALEASALGCVVFVWVLTFLDGAGWLVRVAR